MVVYAAMVMVFGVVGNSVVCYICRCRMSRSVLNNFVLALAVLDLAGCVLVLPLEMTLLHHRFEPPFRFFDFFFYQSSDCRSLCTGQRFWIMLWKDFLSLLGKREWR